MRRLHHVCIQTNDYQASLDFYVSILDFHVVKESPQFHGRAYNTWLKGNGMMIELQTGKKGECLRPYHSQQSGLVHFCFMVNSVQAEYDHIVSRGYEQFALKKGQPIYEVKGSKLLKVIAPEGTIIELRETEIEGEDDCDIQIEGQEHLIDHIDQIHSTPLGIERIRSNLNLQEEDIVNWCKSLVKSETSQILKRGKNWYVRQGEIELTINAGNYNVITGHIRK